ncbi:hypothetical protein S40288_05118 [Stachybotrys chartarum IBT 40288]|nr:hypothetical protein S40288_05118 [Stachybotrys chartarum IBT 40288]
MPDKHLPRGRTLTPAARPVRGLTPERPSPARRLSSHGSRPAVLSPPAASPRSRSHEAAERYPPVASRPDSPRARRESISPRRRVVSPLAPPSPRIGRPDERLRPVGSRRGSYGSPTSRISSPGSPRPAAPARRFSGTAPHQVQFARSPTPPRWRPGAEHRTGTPPKYRPASHGTPPGSRRGSGSRRNSNGPSSPAGHEHGGKGSPRGGGFFKTMATFAGLEALAGHVNTVKEWTDWYSDIQGSPDEMRALAARVITARDTVTQIQGTLEARPDLVEGDAGEKLREQIGDAIADTNKSLKTMSGLLEELSKNNTGEGTVLRGVENFWNSYRYKTSFGEKLQEADADLQKQLAQLSTLMVNIYSRAIMKPAPGGVSAPVPPPAPVQPTAPAAAPVQPKIPAAAPVQPTIPTPAVTAQPDPAPPLSAQLGLLPMQSPPIVQAAPVASPPTAPPLAVPPPAASPSAPPNTASSVKGDDAPPRGRQLNFSRNTPAFVAPPQHQEPPSPATLAQEEEAIAEPVVSPPGATIPPVPPVPASYMPSPPPAVPSTGGAPAPTTSVPAPLNAKPLAEPPIPGPDPKLSSATSPPEATDPDAVIDALLDAAWDGDLTAVTRALRHTPPTSCDLRGLTALHLASERDHLAVAMLLLDRGANIQAHAHNGRTPLHLAARKASADMVEMLLERAEADPNAKTADGKTPLHYAASVAEDGDAERREVLRVLRDWGADPTATDKKGDLPRDVAQKRDFWDAAATLRRAEKKWEDEHHQNWLQRHGLMK